jgi:hypothetical protein
VFSDNVMAAGTKQADWEIRSGVSAGHPGKVVASGWSPASQTLIATWPDGETIYRVQVSGLTMALAAGVYWLSVTPATGARQTYVCATRGANAVTAAGGEGKAFFDSPLHEAHFKVMQSAGQAGTSSRFSQGILVATPSLAR